MFSILRLIIYFDDIQVIWIYYINSLVLSVRPTTIPASAFSMAEPAGLCI
jgi:hypothetical protein